MPKLGTAPLMGREIPKNNLFAYNFLMTVDSLGHAESKVNKFCQNEMNCLYAILKFDINYDIF